MVFFLSLHRHSPLSLVSWNLHLVFEALFLFIFLCLCLIIHPNWFEGTDHRNIHSLIEHSFSLWAFCCLRVVAMCQECARLWENNGQLERHDPFFLNDVTISLVRALLVLWRWHNFLVSDWFWLYSGGSTEEGLWVWFRWAGAGILAPPLTRSVTLASLFSSLSLSFLLCKIGIKITPFS